MARGGIVWQSYPLAYAVNSPRLGVFESEIAQQGTLATAWIAYYYQALMALDSFGQLHLYLGQFLLQEATVHLARHCIALCTRRNVHFIQFHQDLTLCLEGTSWVKVESALDQPMQVVPTRARCGLLCTQLASKSLQVTGQLLKGTAIVQVAKFRFGFECRGWLADKCKAP